MAIDTHCRAYDDALPDWKRMRNVLAGQSAMHLNAAEYLRRPPGLVKAEAWAAYVSAVLFFEATLLTSRGMAGMAFYRAPTIELPTDMAAFNADATQDGVSLVQFIKATFQEVIDLNRACVFLDFPQPDPRVRTRRDEEASNRRPFLRRYDAERLFNWDWSMVRGVRTLTEARLNEWETEKVGEWGSRTRRIIRVLQLVETDGAWSYRMRVFRHKDWEGDGTTVEAGTPSGPEVAGPIQPSASWIEDRVTVPLNDGKPLDYLPFWIINSTDQSPEVRRPNLLGLANANVAHFSTTAQQENALWWSGNPQPYVTGVDPNDTTELLVGSSEAWIFKDANAKADFLSFGADNLEPLEKRLDRLEQHMARLGARMLVPDKAGVEAAETKRIDRQGESSVLGNSCDSVSKAFTDIVAAARDWQGSTGNVSVTIHKAFFDATLTTADALNIIKLWQAGFLAPDDVFALLKRGELVDADRTLEDVTADNQSSPIQPILPNMTNSSTGGFGAGGSGGGTGAAGGQ